VEGEPAPIAASSVCCLRARFSEDGVEQSITISPSMIARFKFSLIAQLEGPAKARSR
jgi:hypothetical protein